MTPQQLATLKAAIIADPTAGPMRLAGDTFSLNAWLAADSTSVVWRTHTSGDAIRNAIVWANMTPAMAPDVTALWTNRALYAQAKQISLQTMVQGRDIVNTGVAGIRAGLNDCLTALPTKNDGTNQPAGWAAVQTAMQRFANNCEKVFAPGGTSAVPVDLVFEGAVTQAELNSLVN